MTPDSLLVSTADDGHGCRSGETDGFLRLQELGSGGHEALNTHSEAITELLPTYDLSHILGSASTQWYFASFPILDKCDIFTRDKPQKRLPGLGT